MFRDKDQQIRDYVRKRQKQKERAKQLRELRLNQEYTSSDGPDTRNVRAKTMPYNHLSDSFAHSSNRYNKDKRAFNNSYHNPLRASLQAPPMLHHRHKRVQQPHRMVHHNSPDPNIQKLYGLLSALTSQVAMQQLQINDLRSEIDAMRETKQNESVSNTSFQSFEQTLQHDLALSNTSSYRSNSVNRSISKSLANLKLKNRKPSRANSRSDSLMNEQPINYQPFGQPTMVYHSQMDDEKQIEKTPFECEYSEKNISDEDDAPAAIDFVQKLANMDNVVQHVERVPCHQCGRKFVQSALERHIKICKDVFGSKRKVFDATKKRLEKEALEAKRNNPNDDRLSRMKAKKKASWKVKSARLRQAIAASRQFTDKGSSSAFVSQTPAYVSSEYDDYVTCPHCSRRFAEKTAERHIPKCKDIIAKPKTLRRSRR